MSLSVNGFPPLEDPNAPEEDGDDRLISERVSTVMVGLAEAGFNAVELQDLGDLIIDSLIDMLSQENDASAIEAITRLEVAQENLMYVDFLGEDDGEIEPGAVITDPIVLN